MSEQRDISEAVPLNGSVERPGQFARMMAAAFLCYLGMVMPMSSISVHVTEAWGLSNLVAGIAAGIAFLSTIVYRKPAGDRIDCQGGKHCFRHGCLWYAAGGAVCLLAAAETLPLPVRLGALLGGRLVLGIGESLNTAGMAYWSVNLKGVDKAGQVFATLGMSVYGAAAVGGQAGFYLYQHTGFFGLMLVSTLTPLGAYLITGGCPDAGRNEVSPVKPSLGKVLRYIWHLGVPTCLIGVGFAVVGAFLSKTFVARGWEYAGWGFSACGFGFVIMRVFIGHLPDRIGGLPVAAVSAVAEMCGLYMLFFAPGQVFALFGAFLTGAGVSMVFPSLGMEVAKTVPTEMRGASLSSYNIFIDVAYGFSGPIAGLLVDRWGEGAAFLFAAQMATLGLFAVLLNMFARRGRAGRGGA